MDRGQTLKETVEVVFDEQQVSLMESDAFPHPISHEEAAVEDTDRRVFARDELPVDVDAHVLVAWIVDRFVCGSSHGGAYRVRDRCRILWVV